jgi:hypothetical protein
MKISNRQQALINDCNFQIQLKGYAELIPDYRQRFGLKENSILALKNKGFNVMRVKNYGVTIYKITL